MKMTRDDIMKAIEDEYRMTRFVYHYHLDMDEEESDLLKCLFHRLEVIHDFQTETEYNELGSQEIIKSLNRNIEFYSDMYRSLNEKGDARLALLYYQKTKALQSILRGLD